MIKTKDAITISCPGREAKSLMGYPLPSFGKASIQTKQTKHVIEILV